MNEWLFGCRSGACVYSVPTGGDPPARASGLVRLLLRHDRPLRSGRSGQLCVVLQSVLFSHICAHTVSRRPLQFIALESIITSLSDIYPSYMRKGYRREVVLFLICALCYLVGQLLVSQVSHLCATGISRLPRLNILIRSALPPPPLFQAGTYILMIFDHYVCSGPALLLLALFQSSIIGWIYGG